MSSTLPLSSLRALPPGHTRALPFSLRQMQYALAVASARNFRRAAELCAVAQPSLSAQVAALEEALGMALFERGRGGVRVTAAGERLLARMAQVLRESAELEEEARGLKDPLSGSLRLGVIPTIAPYLLPALVPSLQRGFPRFLPLWTEERTPVLVRALAEGRLDGALMALEADLGDLEQQPIRRDPFLLCLPGRHPAARQRGPVDLADMAGERLLLLEDGHCLRDQALAACGSTRLEELGFRATSLPTLMQMVASGAGITLLPRLAVAVETARAEVALRPLRRPVPYRTLGLVWRRSSHAAPALKRIGEHLKRDVAWE